MGKTFDKKLNDIKNEKTQKKSKQKNSSNQKTPFSLGVGTLFGLGKKQEPVRGDFEDDYLDDFESDENQIRTASASSARRRSNGNLAAREEDESYQKDLKQTPLRISMLGNTGTGKTAFIAAMNYCLIRNPRYSIQLQLDKNQQYNEMYRNMTDISICNEHGTIDRKFPAGTGDVNTVFPLKLFCTNPDADYDTVGREYFSFEFIDYKGALVKDATNPDAQADNLREFREFLISSDVIFIFVDGVRLSQAETQARREVASDANLYNSIFANLLFDPLAKKRQYDVVLLITKVDDRFIKDEDKADNYKGLVEKAERAFRNIEKRCRSMAIIPVSAVGSGNTETVEIFDEESGDRAWSSSLIRGNQLNPERVELSIFYACSKIAERREKELTAQIMALTASMNESRIPLSKKKKEENERIKEECSEARKEMRRLADYTQVAKSMLLMDWNNFLHEVNRDEDSFF